MPEIPSKSQLEKLGRRLRKADRPSESDLRLLADFRAAHDPALAAVQESLRELGLVPTSRLKTTGTIIEKLIRERTRLGSMHDIAGLRIVEDLTLGAQDELVDMILARFGGELIDRRASPSFGYRAVHVIVRAEECFVEIQVRTRLQNLWAQIMEAIGDRIGRGIRYGEIPADETWARAIQSLAEWGDSIASHERVRASVERREGELASWYSSPEQDREWVEDLARKNAELKEKVEANEVSLIELLQGVLSDLEEGVSD